SNKVFISMIPAKTFTTPLNAAFVRISMKNEDVPFTQLEVGAVTTKYMSHKNSIRKDTIPIITGDLIGVGEIARDRLSFLTVPAVLSKNLFNKDTIILERYVTITGALTANAAYSASDFIAISPGQAYSVNHLWSGACYDSNKVFISMIPAKTFTTPLNAAFVRISMKNED
ncbi:hypothetical protein HPT30_00770, partial [Paenibacillus sp. JW14]